VITMVNLILCSTISFFSLPYVYERGDALTCCYGPCLGVSAVGLKVAGMMPSWWPWSCAWKHADLCKSGYRGAFRVGRGCIRASALVVLVAVSLPSSRLQADAPTLPNRFFLSSLDLCGFRHTCACELASIAGMPDPS